MEKYCDTDVVIFNGSAKSHIWIEKELGLCQEYQTKHLQPDIVVQKKTGRIPIGREWRATGIGSRQPRARETKKDHLRPNRA